MDGDDAAIVTRQGQTRQPLFATLPFLLYPAETPISSDETLKTIRHLYRWLVADGFVARSIRNPVVGVGAPVLAAAYWRFLGPLGERYQVIQSHQSAMEGLVPWIIGITFVLVIWRELGNRYYDFDQSYTASLEKLLNSIGKIIHFKRKRFESKVASLEDGVNVFELITHPLDQMSFIVSEAVEFLADQCNVSTKQFSITVVQVTGPKSGKFLCVNNPDRVHTVIKDLLNEASTLAKCVSTGDPQFHADKNAAAKKGEYLLSDRDRENGCVGSLYCLPVIVQVADRKCTFVVTFSTYGQQFGSRSAEGAVKIYCEQFVQRIRLELTLHAIREIAVPRRASNNRPNQNKPKRRRKP